ncbi:MAG TPA: hypothetical protein VIY71_02780 [Solirubrobacterales bacterium]
MARGGEHIAQDCGNPIRFLVNLLFAEPEHLESPCPEVEVSTPIIPKGLTAPVIAIAIGLDGEPSIAPEKIDQVAVNLNVDLGQREPVPPTDPQEVSLEVAACPIEGNLRTKGKAEYIGLPNRAAPLLLRYNAAKIGDRSRGGRNRDAITPSDVARAKRSAAMQPNAPLPLPAAVMRNHNFNRSCRLFQQPPEGRCAPVANDRALSAGESRRQPTTLGRKPRMTHRVNPAMNPVQPAGLHATRNSTPAQPNPSQLPDRHYAVLTFCDPGEGQVSWGAFVPHTGIKAPGQGILPLHGSNLRVVVPRSDVGGAWALRFGPLSAAKVSVALTAFVR